MQLSDLKPAWLIRREAITWLARRRGHQSPPTEARFQAWYKASHKNAAAYDLEEHRFKRSYGLLRSSPLALDRDLSPTIRHEPASRPRLALAATIAALLLVPGVLFFTLRTDLLGGSPQAMMLVSGVGEIKTFPLADGSSVTLDTQSRVRLDVGRDRRSARVEQGRARFSIKEGLPRFKVTSGSLAVESAGGVLDVAHEEARDVVEVRSGAANLASEKLPAHRLEAGEAAAVSQAGEPRLFAATETIDWTRGMLQFDDTPLAQALAEANLYSVRQVLLGDPALGDLRVTGTFRAGDTEGLVTALRRAFSLEVVAGRHGSLILRGSSKTAPQKKKGG